MKNYIIRYRWVDKDGRAEDHKVYFDANDELDAINLLLQYFKNGSNKVIFIDEVKLNE